MTIQRFEELDVWKNARNLSVKIRDLSLSTALAKDYSLKDQILRSSGSVMRVYSIPIYYKRKPWGNPFPDTQMF